MTKQVILEAKKALEAVKTSNNGDVVTLEHITSVMGKEKLMCMSTEDLTLKFDYAKVFTNDTTGYDSVYAYFKDEKRKQYSMSLNEMKNCFVKTSEGNVEMISFLEELFADSKSFPDYMVVTATEEAEKSVYPLAYYKEYTRSAWNTHREVAKASGKDNEEIRASYILGKTLKAKYADKPFLKSITFEVLD